MSSGFRLGATTRGDGTTTFCVWAPHADAVAVATGDEEVTLDRGLHEGTVAVDHGADRLPDQFVVFAHNHDQVGNRAFGDRLDRGVLPLAAFATLLSGFLPMLFMGEEYGEPAPFRFFTDVVGTAAGIELHDGAVELPARAGARVR